VQYLAVGPVLLGVLIATGVTLLLGLPLTTQYYLNLGLLGVLTNFVSIRQGTRRTLTDVDPNPAANWATAIFLLVVAVSCCGVALDVLVVLQGVLHLQGGVFSLALFLIHAGPERLVRSLISSCFNILAAWIIGLIRERGGEGGFWEYQRRGATVGWRSATVLVVFSVGASLISFGLSDYYASIHPAVLLYSLLAVAVMSRYPTYLLGSLANVFVGARRRAR
jgi:hypothetical protein